MSVLVNSLRNEQLTFSSDLHKHTHRSLRLTLFSLERRWPLGPESQSLDQANGLEPQIVRPTRHKSFGQLATNRLVRSPTVLEPPNPGQSDFFWARKAVDRERERALIKPSQEHRNLAKRMSSDCSANQWGERLLLAPISNALYLATPIYCALLVKYSTLRWYHVMPSALVTTFIAIASTLYHLCDDGDPCSRSCVADWQTLYDMDFLGAYTALPVCAAWYMNAGASSFTVSYLLLTIVESSIYLGLRQSASSDSEYIWYAVIVAQAVLVAVLYTIYLNVKGLLVARFQKNFNLLAGAIALTFTIGGIVAKFLTNYNDPEQYYWQHSLWHIGTAVGICACHMMYSIKPCCCQYGDPSDFDPFMQNSNQTPPPASESQNSNQTPISPSES
jgi:hypothetical protein